MNFAKRAITSAVLCLLFMVVYGGCNWLSSLRTDVGMFYFEWEKHIPFVPWLIVPYMSIDLFFVAAPFLCGSADEVKVLSRRIVFVILVAGTCFLLFPLKFAFERPVAEGWLGVVFNNFRKMDQPYNLLPSLHIALRTILAAVYARHSKGVWRLLSDIWFSLIGLSTLLTYQHHVMDVVGGFVLSAYAFYLFRENAERKPVLKNARVGTYYGIGALAVALVALTLGAWGLLLLWPAISLSVVAAAYFGLGPNIYHKEGGKLPLSTRVVLAPTLFGQYLSLLYYKRQCRPWDEIAPNVWIGRKLNRAEAAKAVEGGITAVLDLTVEFAEPKPFLNVTYLNIPILDLTAPTQQQLQSMADFIARESQHAIVYVHCKIGYSRSAAAIGAHLIRKESLDVKSVVDRLKRVRPSIIVRPEIFTALECFSQRRSLEKDLKEA